MTTLEKNLLRGLALLTLAAAAVAPAHAQDARVRSWTPAGASSPTFAYSGAYSGSIGSQVNIGEYGFWISPKTTVYQIGSGLVPLSQLPIGTVVYATGTDKGGLRTVMVLIARPSAEGSAAPSDAAANVKERDPKAPL